MKPIEALADAIMQFEGWHLGSRSWRNRNPGNLRPLNNTPKSYEMVDEDNYLVFSSLGQGFQALLVDLMAKFNGSHGLTSESTMLDLLNVYAPAGDANNPTEYTRFVCTWVTKATGRPVLMTTKLGDFISGASH